MMTRNDIFVRRAYKKALFPVMFSVLGGTINTLIDSAFVSQSEGADALAAVNLCMPIYLALCVAGALFANGAATIAANEIGLNNIDGAKNAYFSALKLYIVTGIVLTVLGCLIMHPVSDLLSQGTHLSGLVYDYGLITCIGAIPTIIIYQPISFLQLDGKSESISRMMTVMLIVDILLDYLFLFVFGFGVKGAAAASIIATSVACVMGFISLQRGYLFRFERRRFKISRTKEIIKLGSMLAAGNLLDAVKMIMLNAVILSTIGAHGVAIWAVLNSLSEISITVTTGVPQTAAPMIGVYFPSRENAAIRSLMKLQLRWGLSILVPFFVVVTVGHGAVEALFAVNYNMLFSLICLSISTIIDLVLSMWVRFFSSTRKVLLSNMINVIRKFLGPVIFVYVFSGLNDNIWIFLPVGSLFTMITGVMILLMIRVSRKNKNKPVLSGLLLLDDSYERENKILDFSIKADAAEVCDGAERIREFCVLNEMDKKLSMRLSLSIEELLMVLINRFPETESIDLRAFVTLGETGLQIRMIGEMFDPFTEAEKDENADELMGIIMMKKMAAATNYYYALGMNTLHIFFER
ncbi:MAG: polysaccharide biosynthesis C-terminal domain-containing protein [Eubacterium sp.]|nr:polysaccharide biosynthesis C-terminal domain-containing protein [Eubacterium sp.]